MSEDPLKTSEEVLEQYNKSESKKNDVGERWLYAIQAAATFHKLAQAHLDLHAKLDEVIETVEDSEDD